MAPRLAGLLFELTGGYSAAVAVAGIILLGAAVASFTIDERMSRKQRLASVQR